MSWNIDDGHGNAITAGVQEHLVYAMARRLADERGEAVAIWRDGSDEYEAIIEPTGACRVRRSRRAKSGDRLMSPRYTTWGPVRGDCGHVHRSEETADRCLAADRAGCAAQGGYSDREIRAIQSRADLARYDVTAGPGAVQS